VSTNDRAVGPERLVEVSTFPFPTAETGLTSTRSKLTSENQKSSPDEPLAVSFERAGQLTDLGQTKLRELAKDGTLETTHVGTRNLILYASLKKLVLGVAS
jgi:hypothetical protein